MLKVFRKHPKIIIGICILVIVIAVASVYQRQQYMKNPYKNQLNNPKRSTQSLIDMFYYEQLTDKEKEAYKVLQDAIENLKGGIVKFPEGLTGVEYSRITLALECGQEDYFYCMVEIPMTSDNQNVSYIQKNILNVTDNIITQCLLLLYPAEGININGQIDKDGYVTNLDELKDPLASLNKEKVQRIEELDRKSVEILDAVCDAMPAEYGTKDAIDYFLDWMDENLILDEELMGSTASVTNMSEAFEKVYFENHRSCVVEGKAMASGYSKVLAYLLNRTGIDAHVVMGNWKASNAYTLVCVDFDGTPVFIDASGYKGKDLWEQRYISQTLATRYLTFMDYFDSVK